jgi:hypothetical protein
VIGMNGNENLVENGIKKIEVWVKGEFEDWEHARLAQFYGKRIDDSDELYEFIYRLLRKTEYSDYAVTAIYKVVGYSYIIVLFKQTENSYGGFVGSVSTYLTLDELIKAVKNSKIGGDKNE